MKKYAILSLAILLGIILISCSTTQTGVSSTNNDRVIQVDYPTSLASILTRSPSLYVEENGPYTRVLLRGSTPLFVVDGMRVGYSYAAAESAVNVHDIASVEVLTSPSETMMYGREGSNGVIVIRTGFSEERDNQ